MPFSTCPMCNLMQMSSLAFHLTCRYAWHLLAGDLLLLFSASFPCVHPFSYDLCHFLMLVASPRLCPPADVLARCRARCLASEA